MLDHRNDEFEKNIKYNRISLCIVLQHINDEYEEFVNHFYCKQKFDYLKFMK